MRPMLARVIGGLIVALVAGAPFQATADKVDQYVRQQVKQRGMPGLSLAVVRHGQVIKAQGYGVASLELAAPATADTVYEIGSVLNRADGYMPDGERLRRGEAARPEIIAPNGGILTTVLDMARWDAAFFGGRLVRPESMAKMREPVRVAGGQAFTHGFAVFMDTFNGHRMAFHPGTTVAGYSAVFYHFADDELAVILMTNLNDGAFGVDAMAHRIADFYVPGVWLNSLTPQPDNDPKITQTIVSLLRDLAEGRDASGLAPNLRASGISDARRKTVASHMKEQTAFVFVGEERRTADHWILAPGVARIRRYQMTAGAKTVYYTFQLTGEGQVAQFSVVENP